jgi:7,8-dihydro-6-hydroxymethylpterin-pyrophosphokinase
MQTGELTLPHPGLRDRAFWQRELAELTTLMSARS